MTEELDDKDEWKGNAIAPLYHCPNCKRYTQNHPCVTCGGAVELISTTDEEFTWHCQNTDRVLLDLAEEGLDRD